MNKLTFLLIPALRRLLFLIIGMIIILLCGGMNSAIAQDRGNTSALEYGDPVYRELGGFAGFLGYNYNHTGVFAGLDFNHSGRVRQALGSDTTTQEAYLYTEFTGPGHDYYGAYTLSNRVMNFIERKSVVNTASDLVNAAIAYPSTFLQAPVCLVYYGLSFEGTVADISNIRCDGFVEYCYEKNGFRVWRNQLYADNTWSIVEYPDSHNDRPDATRNPETEASPWSQRGAPTGLTGPQVIIDLGYSSPDTKMTSPSVIRLPTYEVTGVDGNGFVDVTIRATDESGIHLIGYWKPGDTVWSYSPTQAQDPMSDSYSYTVRVTQSGSFYVFAIDNGWNYPAHSQEYVVTVGSTSVQPKTHEPPLAYSLSQNYPNPFNPSTTIRYSLPISAEVTLTVYSSIGQQVSVLQAGAQKAGHHEVKFDGTNLASGVYFYRLQAGSYCRTMKLLLLR